MPTSVVRAVLEAGVPDVGENRAQELLAKAPELHRSPGALALPRAAAAQQGANVGAARRLVAHRRPPRVGRRDRAARPGARVLVEVNLGGEPQKGGCDPDGVAALVDGLSELGLSVGGLMTVPPRDSEPRRWFAALRGVASDLGLEELSMGMTDDFEVAVEEGATMVRVGRALFGERAAPAAHPANPDPGSPNPTEPGPDDRLTRDGFNVASNHDLPGLAGR